jgi:hypothetical protein
MAALGVPAHARARRALIALAAAAGLTAGCGVPGRDELVGRYTADGESWSLAADGTCQIARAETVRRCEWEYVERDGRKTLAVTLLGEPGSATRHRTRLVLTPSRVLGGAVTIPLGGGELRKVE